MLETAVDAVMVAPATLLFVEIMLRCRLAGHVGSLMEHATRAFKVLTARRISDHWKELVMPVYALAIMKCALALLFWLTVLFAAFLSAVYLAGDILQPDFSLIEEMSRPAPQFLALTIGLAYGLLRTRLGRSPGDKRP